MGKTKIEWTRNDDGTPGRTWNPVRGCSVVSEGCRNCYAMNFATRFAGKGEPYEGLAYRNESGAHWTGKVRLIEEHLNDPLKWRKPARVFVNSMSDLFHEALTDGQILRVFEAMLRCPQHTFQVLTKRPARMLEWFGRWEDLTGEPSEPQLVRGPTETRKAHPSGRGQMYAEYLETLGSEPPPGCAWPTFDWMEGMRWWPRSVMTQPNIWLGVSVEDQKTADERIPLLLQTPAAVRWISAEPCLAHIDLRKFLYEDGRTGVSRTDGVGLVLSGHAGANMETRRVHGRENKHGIQSTSEGATGREVEVCDGWLSEGNVPRRGSEASHQRPSHCLDGEQSQADPGHLRGQSPERDQTRQSSGESRSNSATAERHACDSRARENTASPQTLSGDFDRAGRSSDPGNLQGGRHQSEAASRAVQDSLAHHQQYHSSEKLEASPRLDWVVVGGESGPKARSMHPDWARSLRDQCVAAGVPFFFKQWGEYLPESQVKGDQIFGTFAHGSTTHKFKDAEVAYRMGKKAAGRLLDGREWSEYPQAKVVTSAA